MLNTYNMTLADTVPYMNSNDYKERFIGEYWQTKIRYDKLHNMLVKYEADTLDFEPSCSFDLLTEQAQYMGLYLKKLEVRAAIEDIDLEQPFKVKTNENTSNIPFVTGLSIDGEDNHQYTIEELESMTTSTHSDGYVEASDVKWEDNYKDDVEDDFSFEEMCKCFKTGLKVSHEIFGTGIISSMWYDLNEEGNSLTMDVKWDNGATVVFDSYKPYHRKIISELVVG